MTIDSSQFYSAGYFLIRSGHPGWEQLDLQLLPAKLMSLSNHICSHLKMTWGWIPENRDAALQFGIPEMHLDAFLDWCQQEYARDMDLTSMFYTPEAARRFVRRFDLPTEDLHIIGVGIPQTFVERLWSEPSTDELYGVEKLIDQRVLLEADGQPLGFELVTYEYQDFGCSWLCTYAHQDINTRYGIRPNAYGLLETFQDALTVYEWIEDKSEGPRGEPVPYDVVLLVEYPLAIEVNNGKF